MEFCAESLCIAAGSPGELAGLDTLHLRPQAGELLGKPRAAVFWKPGGRPLPESRKTKMRRNSPFFRWWNRGTVCGVTLRKACAKRLLRLPDLQKEV